MNKKQKNLLIRIYNPKADLNDLVALAESCSYRAVQARRSAASQG